MKKIKRLTAMIMAAAMLFMLAVNASAADSIVCKKYTLQCDFYADDSKVYNNDNFRASVSFVPTITPTVSGNARYRISGMRMNFALNQNFDGIDFDEKNVSVLYWVSIEYSISDGRTYYKTFEAWQYLGDFKTELYIDKQSASTYITIPPIDDPGYFNTVSVAVEAFLYVNSSVTEYSGTDIALIAPFNGQRVKMATIVAENT